MQNLRTIQVFTNFYENYNIDEPTPYYKIKGTHVFEIKVDFDDLMYRKEELTAAINDMIAKNTNPSNSPMACKYIITNIELKNDVTEFPTLTSQDLTKYKPTRSNKINPALCSRAAKESIREIKNYREVCDFTDVENRTHEVFTW